MNWPFLTPGFYPTSVVGTPTNAQLEQMVVEAKPAANSGMVVYSDAAPDVVTYPDLAKAVWHKTTAGVRTGYLYYYNGTAWTPMKVSPGSLTGDSFADGSLGIEKLEPGAPYQVPQTDASGLTVGWTNPVDLFNAGSFAWGKLALASGQDRFFVSGLGGTWSEVTKQVAADKLSTVPQTTVITSFSDLDDDGLWTYEAATNAVKGISHRRYLEMLAEAFNSLTTTATGDKVMVLDVSETAGLRMKAVTLANLLPDVGAAASYTNVTGLSVNTKGQVTSVTTSGSGQTFVSDALTIPTAAGTGSQVTATHGLGAAPTRVDAVAVCQVNDNGYVAGDVIPLSHVKFDTGSAAYNAHYIVYADATTVYLIKPNYTTVYVLTKGATPTFAAFTPSSWKARITAVK